MTRNTLRLSKLSLGLITALAAASAFAQSTSAGVGGMVTGADGQPVADAEVTITHVESGTVSRATTDANGRYNARGLRVGGPYTVTVSKAGVGSDVETNIYLALDATNAVDAQLGTAAAPAGDATDLATVTVVAPVGTDVFSADSIGAATTVTREQIEALPSIRRSLEDYVKLDPRIVQVDEERGGISAAGQNNRYNSIRVDGVPTNDNFGLNDSGVPALNQPIVIDWIQEFNIGISDYDVTQGDFVGANINAVTKSGTNEFHGAVYGIYRDQDMIGDEIDGQKRAAPYKDEITYGAYVGGPLIKDRLFFFAGYEKFERNSPAPDKGPAGSGAATEFGVTETQLAQIRAASAGFGQPDIGSFQPLSEFTNEDDKWFAKLDWNIADGQRASFRYNKTEGSVLRLNTGATTLQADSNWFSDEISFENWAAMLYSDWTANFSTEANVSYSEYRSLPESFSNFPQVSVTVANGGPGGVGNGFVQFGRERSRHANELAVDTTTAYLAGTYYAGDHELKFGGDYETSDVFNLFLQDTIGNYEFASITAFQAGQWSRYRYQAARSGNLEDVAAQFDVGTFGLFVQDTWTVNNNLTLMFGVRADQTMVGGTPAENVQFRNDFGVDNRNTPDGEWTVQPRAGFNYTFDSDLRAQLRGGVGLFLGSAPGVWLSNSFSNPGVLVNSYDIRNGVGVSLDPNAPLVPAAAGAQQLVNAMADDFEQPTIWKANLAFEKELPWMGLVASAEFLATKTERGVHYVNQGLGPVRGFLPDGRESYWTTTSTTGFSQTNGNPTATNFRRANCIRLNPAAPLSTANPCRYTNAIVLENTDKGSSQNFTMALEKPWENGWYAKVAYTVGHSRDVSPGTSSVALSNWENRYIYNPNEEIDSRSNYEVLNRATLALSKRWNFFGDKAPTTFSMFYEGRNGRPFSYIFNNDANGDGTTFGNDLFYVPAGPSDVAFTAGSTAADRQAFWDYLASNSELNGYAGSPTRRNIGTSPWNNQIDIRLQQEIPLGFGETRLEVFLDIQNLGNLLNKEWGQVQEAGFPYAVTLPVNFAGVNANGQYVYDVSGFVNEQTGVVRNIALPYRNFESRWAAQVGVRFEF
jgi:outer membrane receptor for ferrienterochelin and colicin